MFQTLRRASALIDRRRKRWFVLVAMLALAVSVLEAVSAVLVLVLLQLIVDGDQVVLPVVGDLADLVPEASQADLITWFGAVFVAFFLLRAAFFVGQQYAMSRVAQHAGTEIADRLLRAYLHAPYEFHLGRNSAESVRNVYENVQQLVASTFVPAATVFAESVLVVLMLAVLVVADPVSTVLAAVVVGSAVVLTLVAIQPRLKRLGRERQAAARDAIQHVQQGLQGIRDIKVAGREDAFAGVFRRARSRLARAEYIRAALVYLPRVSIESAFLLFIVGVLLLDQLTGLVDGLLATLGLFAYAGMRMQPSLQKIATNLNNLRYGEAVVHELSADFDELDITPSAPRATAAVAVVQPEPLAFRHELRLDHVSFRYGNDARPVLDELSLTICPGQSIGIAGHTGCGKSTLLDLICGLLRPTSGTITVDGVDINSDVRAWQRALGVVHQQSFMVDDTIRRNIALGVPDADVDLDELREVVEAAGLAPVVADLPDGLDTPLGERGVRLSGGQRQRVALARALYRRPSLLLLDEATAALDNATERAVVANIARFASGRMAIVAVAHRMQTIVGCDQVVFLSDGRLAGSGTFDQLRNSNPEFAAMSP